MIDQMLRLAVNHKPQQELLSDHTVMRPLFAIAPLAFVFALMSPAPIELGASLASFKAMFANLADDTTSPAQAQSNVNAAQVGISH